MTVRHATNHDDGARIAYELREEAQPHAPWVVLVHGLGYGRWGWGPTADALAATANLVLIDNRGIGDSDVPPGPYDARQMAGDVAAVLDDAGLDRAHVVGTSLGGMVAQQLAATRPERVDRLVLLSTTPGGDDAVPMPEATRELIAQAQNMGPAEALRALTANALSAQARGQDPELTDHVVALRAANPPDPDGWQAQAAAGVAYDGGGAERRITAPTLVVHGDADAVVHPDNAPLLAERIPSARLVLLEGAGHLLPFEVPETLAALVSDFVVGQDPR